MLEIRRIDADDREIGLGIGADELRGIDARVMQRDFDLARAVDDVAVREDEAVARDDETGAAALAAFAAEHADVHHARRDTIHDRGDRLRIGVEQLTVVRQLCADVATADTVVIARIEPGYGMIWRIVDPYQGRVSPMMNVGAVRSVCADRRKCHARLRAIVEFPSSRLRRPSRFSPSPDARRSL